MTKEQFRQRLGMANAGMIDLTSDDELEDVFSGNNGRLSYGNSMNFASFFVMNFKAEIVIGYVHVDTIKKVQLILDARKEEKEYEVY